MPWRLLLAFCLALLPTFPANAAMHAGLTLIEDAPATPSLPRNWRAAHDKLRRGTGAPVDLRGLKGLKLSGSGQFSEPQLKAMQKKLPARCATIVDLRQESHGTVNDLAVSWYAAKDWANLGLDVAKVRADEERRLAVLLRAGRAVITRVLKKTPQDAIGQGQAFAVKVKSVSSEAGLCKRYGLGYYRLAITDHLRPSDADVDRFLAFYRGLPAGTWLHFHCHAGLGRTTTFMLMVDMLKNAAAVSLDDLGRRQHLLGGLDLLGHPPNNWKRQAYQKRAAFLRLFYVFAKSGAKGSWTEWVEGRKK